MAKDPVGGMEVDVKKAAGKSLYKGIDVYFCALGCKEKFDSAPESFMGLSGAKRPEAASHDMAKDPICGMVVQKEKSLKSELGGRSYYFCSVGCQRTFEAPEEELKSLKKRVSIALAGVLVLAVLRAGFFLGLATGATIITWAPIPQLPWFTWGVWLFILVK